MRALKEVKEFGKRGRGSLKLSVIDQIDARILYELFRFVTAEAVQFSLSLVQQAGLEVSKAIGVARVSHYFCYRAEIAVFGDGSPEISVDLSCVSDAEEDIVFEEAFILNAVELSCGPEDSGPFFTARGWQRPGH